MKISSEEIAPIINNINKAQVRAERFGRERVLALILQSKGYSEFIFSPQKVGLRGYKKEKESVVLTIQRIEQTTFTYQPCIVKDIVHTLSTTLPFHACNQAGEVRIANSIASMGCGEKGSLFVLFDRMMHIQNPSPQSRQEAFIRIRNIHHVSVGKLSNLLQNRGIDPNISREEISYFKEYVEKSKATKQ